MLTIQTGKAADVTNSDFQRDIGHYAHIETPAGLELTVGMVADAVRGDELAPQAAIAGAMQSLSQSEETDIPTLIREAYETAHRAVRMLSQQEGKQLATTLAMALIVNNDMLYVANLGHSRVYLYQAEAGQLLPLTLDHYFANVAVQEKQMTMEQAAEHPDAEVLSKYIGTPTLIEPDIAIYGGVDSVEEAVEQGQTGLKLQPGDAVLIASNGLTRPSKQGYPVITVDEINRALYSEEAQQAALDIVEAARRQRPTETISAVVLKVATRVEKKGRIALSTLLGATVATIMFVAIIGFIIWSARVPETPVQPTRSDDEKTALALEIILSFTPTFTPSVTPIPSPTFTPVTDRVALNYPNDAAADADDFTMVIQRRSISTGEQDRKILVNHPFSDIVNEGLVLAQRFTDLRFEQVTDELMALSLRREGDIFVATFDYPQVEIRLVQIPDLILYGEDTCLAAYYSTDAGREEVTVSCYAGECSYRLPDNDDDPVSIPAGSQIHIAMDRVTVDNPPAPIPVSEAQRYRELWERTLDFDQESCIADVLPTPTPTTTATEIVLPTFTALPTNTPRRSRGRGILSTLTPDVTTPEATATPDNP